MSEQKTTQQPEQELSEQRRVRREKLAALQAAGEDPFQQTRFDWDATSAQIKEHFDQMEGRAAECGSCGHRAGGTPPERPRISAATGRVLCP